MTEPEAQLRMLLADDDPMVCTVVQRALEGWFGPGVTTVNDGDAALAALESGAFDLVLTDLKMPGANGIDVARAARGLRPAPAVVVMTGYAQPDDEEAIAECGATLLHKPFDARELRVMIQAALDAQRL